MTISNSIRLACGVACIVMGLSASGLGAATYSANGTVSIRDTNYSIPSGSGILRIQCRLRY